MSDYIIYATFPDKEQAISLIALLQDANIEYEIDESSSLFKALASDQPIFDRIKIKINASDVERVDSLIEQDNETASVEHFLYTFSDEDLVDVIKNSKEWTQEEAEIAKKIIIERGIDVNRNRRKMYNTLTESGDIEISEFEERLTKEGIRIGNNKEEEHTNETKNDAGLEAFLAIVGLCSIIYPIQIKLKIGLFGRITEFFMSPSSYYISELYSELHGFLFSCFILILAAFTYLKHKWAIFFAAIIFMHDTYLYFDYYDERVLGFFRGARCIGLLMALQSPAINEEPQ